MRESTEIRQQQIKSAVLNIIATEGLSRLSTRNLADKVGLSEGAIFRHFKTKRDIMLAIMQDVESELIGELRRIALKNEPAPQRLFDYLCAHVRYLVEKKGVTILLFSEAAHLNDSELKNRLHSILNMQKQLVSKIFQDGIVAGEWDATLQTESLASLYMGIPISLNIEMVLSSYEIRLENFCERMCDLLKRALKA